LNIRIIGLVLASFCMFDSQAGQETPAQLDIFSDKPLKQMYFRYAEGSLRHAPSEKWIKRWSRFDGLVLKAFGEEGGYFGDKERQTLRQFKQQYPSKALLLHFNGRARDPMFPLIKGQARDFLYFAGTKSSSNISSSETISTISVKNPSVFAMTRSLPEGVYDDVVIVKYDRSNGIDWTQYEHAKLLEVNVEKRQIKVQRDITHRGRIALGAGQAHIARHAAKGPFFPKSKQRLWEYNWFAAADAYNASHSLQRSLIDFLVAQLTVSHSFFDGVSIDVLTETRLSRTGGYPGLLDLDQDGDGDIPTPASDLKHAKSMYQFLRNLRAALPTDKLIIADGDYVNQRAMDYVNGIESEGWPNYRDPQLVQWSSGLNKQLYWNQFGLLPHLSYFKLAEYFDSKNAKINPTDKVRRLTVAAAVLTDSIVVPAHRPHGLPFHKWPEFRPLKNLGKALGEVKTLRTSQAINVISAGMAAKQIEQVLVSNTQFKLESEFITFENVSEEKPLCLKVDTDNQEFTLSLNAKITPEPALPASRPKIISMHAGPGSPKRMGLFGASFFESQYYFANTPTATICMSLASPGNIMISNIDLFKGADIRYREYENGLLIVNPSTLHAKYTQTSVPLKVSKPAYNDQLMKRTIPARDFFILRP
jgi:hypothetical protein